MDLLVTGTFSLSNATFTDATTNVPRFRTATKRVQLSANHLETYLYGIPLGRADASKYATPDELSEEALAADDELAVLADLELIGTLRLAQYATDSGHSVVVNSRDITPKRVHMLTSGETFTATNGKEYKWKIESQMSGDCKVGALRSLYDRELKAVIAEYTSRKRLSKKPGKLHIAEEGLPVLNEIIATLVYKIRRWDNGW
ncbi:hypothetical protein FB107DRAFT_291326 [Schizophyllum commune]